MNDLGENIRKLRLLFDIKQQTMAKLIGISVNSYGKIERNEVSVSRERLTQIAKVLGVDVMHIIDFNKFVAAFKSPSPSKVGDKEN